MNPTCIFCKIISGTIPSYKVWEDDNYLAFLTIQPIRSGHVLVIPKKHDGYLYDLQEKEIGDLFAATKPLAQKMKEVFRPKSGKIGVIVAGMGVPHVHIHLIPMDSEEDLNFNNHKASNAGELEKIQQDLQI